MNNNEDMTAPDFVEQEPDADTRAALIGLMVAVDNELSDADNASRLLNGERVIVQIGHLVPFKNWPYYVPKLMQFYDSVGWINAIDADADWMFKLKWVPPVRLVKP